MLLRGLRVPCVCLSARCLVMQAVKAGGAKRPAKARKTAAKKPKAKKERKKHPNPEAEKLLMGECEGV